MFRFWQRLTEKQKNIVQYLLLGAVLGLSLLLIRPNPKEVTKVREVVEQRVEISLKQALEQDLTSLLNKSLGGKHTQVLITFERGKKLVIAEDFSEEERFLNQELQEIKRTKKPVILKDDARRTETALVLEEFDPIVSGVLVVIDLKISEEKRLEIMRGVSTVLQIPLHRIEVLTK